MDPLIDEDNDIELGEVVQIKDDSEEEEQSNDKMLEKLGDVKRPASNLTLKEDPAIVVLENENECRNDNTCEQEEPVILSKKIVPFVRPRIVDWLEKCAEFSFKISLKTNVNDRDLVFDLLRRAWPRLLLTYMIENSFEFCVSKDYSGQASFVNEQQESSGTSINHSSVNSTNCIDTSLPRERHAIELRDLISVGCSFGLNTQEHDQLREFVLFKEGKWNKYLFCCFIDSSGQVLDPVNKLSLKSSLHRNF